MFNARRSVRGVNVERPVVSTSVVREHQRPLEGRIVEPQSRMRKMMVHSQPSQNQNKIEYIIEAIRRKLFIFLANSFYFHDYHSIFFTFR